MWTENAHMLYAKIFKFKLNDATEVKYSMLICRACCWSVSLHRHPVTRSSVTVRKRKFKIETRTKCYKIFKLKSCFNKNMVKGNELLPITFHFNAFDAKPIRSQSSHHFHHISVPSHQHVCTWYTTTHAQPELEIQCNAVIITKYSNVSQTIFKLQIS